MKSSRRRSVFPRILACAAAALLLGVLASGGAEAATAQINFIELSSGGIHVTGVDANGTAIDTTKASAEEFFISSPEVPTGYSPDLTLSHIGISRTDPGNGYLFALSELSGGPISDYVWVHQYVPSFTVIDFISDPSSVLITPTATVVEDGSLQYIGSYFNDLQEEVAISIQSPSATPLPAALPLFASGLGALGLLGWRRKRKAQASA